MPDPQPMSDDDRLAMAAQADDTEAAWEEAEAEVDPDKGDGP